MRAILITGALALLVAHVPPASALNVCLGDVDEPWRFQRCIIRQAAPGYNPPDPPHPTSPEFPQFTVEFVKYIIYYALCTTLDPPGFELKEDCGPIAMVSGAQLPPLP